MKSKDRVPAGYKEGTPDWDAQYNMLLDDGFACSDCVNLRKCAGMYGQDANADACQWHPNRFRLSVFSPKTAFGLVYGERQRQEGKGYTSEHDDRHQDSELAFAACYYAMPCMLARRCDNGKPCPVTPDEFFSETGWESQYARRGDKTPLRRTVIAAALLLAEIDRRLRLGEKP